jgi:hypothetical protein
MRPSAMSNLSPSELHALVLLVPEILLQLDEVVALRKRNAGAQLSLTMLREMCGVLKELDVRCCEGYFHVLVLHATMQQIPVEEDFDDQYVELSISSKQDLLMRIVDDLTVAAA